MASSEYLKEYRKRNKEKILAKEKERYRRKQREIKARQKKYYDRNKAEILKKQKTAEKLAKRANNQLARTARKLDQFIEDVDRVVVYEMHGGRCGICGEFISDDFHVDHVVPLSKGGQHGYINVQPAHPKCNEKKHNSMEGGDATDDHCTSVCIPICM